MKAALALALLALATGPAAGWTVVNSGVPGTASFASHLWDDGGFTLSCGREDHVDLWLARAASAHDAGEIVQVTLQAGQISGQVDATVFRSENFDGVRVQLPTYDPFFQDLILSPALSVTVPGLARWTVPLEGFAEPARAFLAGCLRPVR